MENHDTKLKFREFYPLGFFSTNLENTVITRYQQQSADPLRLNINPLTPNDPYRRLTATLTSKVAFYIFIQQI